MTTIKIIRRTDDQGKMDVQVLIDKFFSQNDLVKLLVKFIILWCKEKNEPYEIVEVDERKETP